MNHFKLFSMVYESSKEEDEYPSHNPFLKKHMQQWIRRENKLPILPRL